MCCQVELCLFVAVPVVNDSVQMPTYGMVDMAFDLI